MELRQGHNNAENESEREKVREREEEPEEQEERVTETQKGVTTGHLSYTEFGTTTVQGMESLGTSLFTSRLAHRVHPFRSGFPIKRDMKHRTQTRGTALRSGAVRRGTLFGGGVGHDHIGPRPTAREGGAERS